jgi:NO-binding membrane sensor protein with MHYT domain
MKKRFNEEFKPFMLLIALGLLLASFALITSFLLPSIGANIGGGIAILVGLIALMTGFIGLSVVSKKLWLTILVIASCVIGVYALYSSWAAAEEELNRISCQEAQEENTLREFDLEFCSKYLD